MITFAAGMMFVALAATATLVILNAVSAITSVRMSRTVGQAMSRAALDCHVEQCDACGHQRIAFNSCRNRHCPKRLSLARAQ